MNAAEVMDKLAATNHVTRTRWYPFDRQGTFELADGHEYSLSTGDYGIVLEDDVSVSWFADFDGLLQWIRGYNKAYRNALRKEDK